MRDTLLPYPQWSRLSNGVSVDIDGLTTLASTCTTSLVSELSRGSTEKLSPMKERNEQNGRTASAKLAVRCGSHISCCQICIVKLCPNADPKCASRSLMLGTTDSVWDSNRWSMRHSRSAHFAPKTTERMYDMKCYARVTSVRTRLCLVSSKLDFTLMIYFGVQY